MNVISRSLTAFALAMVIALTSLQMAAARGQAMPVGSMVICAGQGVVTILVDENGDPTGAVHICPDCAMSLFVAEVGGFVPLPPVQAWVRLALDRAETRVAGRDAPTAQARGPPVFV